MCVIETVGATLEVPRKPLHRVEIASNGRRREVPALEFLQHDAATMGHKTPPVTRTLPRGPSAPHAQRPPRQRLGPNAAGFIDLTAGIRRALGSTPIASCPREDSGPAVHAT